MRKIFAHIICHNEFPDILRAIESVAPIADEVFVLHDGSHQPMIDFLEARKEIYNLKIFQNPFITLREQRQFLLDQTPINNWVVCLDADESYSMATTRELRDCLLYKLSEKHYNTAREGNVPLVINIPVLNLVKDITHFDSEGVYHSQKIFYYTKGLHWDFDSYYTHITYKKGPLNFEDGDETTVYSIIGPNTWIIKHFARLNPERLAWRAKHINDKRFGGYEVNAWEKEPPEIVELEQDKW